MIDGMFNSGAMPALHRMMQFTEQRQGHLADAIANASTPNYRPRDLDPADFQRALGEAIDRRRTTGNPIGGELELRDTRQLDFRQGRLVSQPQPRDENLLFHDRNNRSLEQLMQDQAENVMAHRFATEMLRNQYDMLRTAIRERM
mgnify:FL=1